MLYVLPAVEESIMLLIIYLNDSYLIIMEFIFHLEKKTFRFLSVVAVYLPFNLSLIIYSPIN